jgi:hypothetical protein
VIATTDVSSRTPDVVDEHFYLDTPSLIDLSHRYDSYTRSGPKIFIGEYAARGGTNPGLAANLGGAIGEAAFMTGVERNADIVMGSAYAPLFVNDNRQDWNPDLIAFNAQSVYSRQTTMCSSSSAATPATSSSRPKRAMVTARCSPQQAWPRATTPFTLK